MMLKWVIIGVVAVVATLVVGAVVWSGDESGKPGHGEGMHMAKRACMAELTAEQRETLHATIAELKEAGASKEEFHQALAEMCEELGIECPKMEGKCPKMEGSHGVHKEGHGGGGMMQQLTPAQREELKATIAPMKEAGTSKQEIHAAIAELFTKWGIERPHKASSGVCPKSQE